MSSDSGDVVYKFKYKSKKGIIKLIKMAGKSRRAEISKVRAVFSCMASEYLGKRGVEIGKLINKSPGSVSQLYQKGRKADRRRACSDGKANEFMSTFKLLNNVPYTLIRNVPYTRPLY